MRKLQDQRFVMPGGRPNMRSRYYEIKDRLFRIWLQMREDRALKGKLQFLVEFFERWYGERFDEVKLATRKLTETLWENLEAGNTARCSACLRTLAYIGSAAKWDANLRVSRALSDIVDLPNEDPQHFARDAKDCRAIQRPSVRSDRDLLGSLIALISDWLDEPDH